MRSASRPPVRAAALLALALAFPAAAQTLNPTGRTVELAMPLRQDGFYLGDVVLRLAADDRFSVDAARLLELLDPTLAADARDRLLELAAASGRLTPGDVAEAGLRLVYDPALLELRVDMPIERRGVTELGVRRQRRGPPADALPEAALAGYLNLAAAIDHVHRAESGDTGTGHPTLSADGALRSLGVVLEAEVEADGEHGDIDRRGTRLVMDDTERLVRWRGGDLRMPVAGFQASRDTLGVGLERRYGELAPGRSIRPTGRHSFSLDSTADVDLMVNGRMMRRFRLRPGNYDLRDFPLTVGANRVTLLVRDESGRVEEIAFDLFSAATLLEPGLAEFALTAGVNAPISQGERDYQRGEPQVSGFYRRGMQENLTLRVDGQGDRRSAQLGAGIATATPLGALSLDLAGSRLEDGRLDYAFDLGYSLQLGLLPGETRRSLNLSLEGTGGDFARLGTDGEPSNPVRYRLDARYSQALPFSVRGSLDAGHSWGRGKEEDSWSAGFGLDRGFGQWSAGVSASWRSSGVQEGFGALFTVSWKLGPRQRLRASYDTAAPRGRVDYTTTDLGGIERLNANLGIEGTDDTAGVTGAVQYSGNRGEISLHHDLRFTDLGGEMGEETSTLRGQAGIAFADGAVALGRQIGGSFAIIEGHPSLEGRTVLASPSGTGAAAQSGFLGPALVPSLGAYTAASVPYDVDGLPPGYDLGTGAFQLAPAYRSGYRLTVGSSYTVTAMGTLLDEEGEPLALLAGEAREVGDADRAPVTFFTNRAGRFAAQGLAPGRWRLTLAGERQVTYELEISEDAVGLVRAGTLTPMTP
ncbi:fimbria/pilus outer membrane usher protein [Geminicoccaceae bacterium 1502E]|nr:fimbria/pilus outer membrane usher protein [Geminicoccaceae bacterium 1502E]